MAGSPRKRARREAQDEGLEVPDGPKAHREKRDRERAEAAEREKVAAGERAVVAAVTRWGLGDTHVDPAETLMRLLSQATQRAEEYAAELASQVDNTSLAKALVGEVRVPTENGSYVSGEYIRGLAQLEAAERDRVAHFAKTAIAARLGERRVELAEAQGRLVADMLRAALGDPELGLTPEQRSAIPGVLRRAQAAVIAVPAERADQPAQVTAGAPT